MKITTKFSIGERVWVIARSHVYQPHPCRTCNESGSIEIQGDTFVCPRCSGRKMEQRGCERWHVDRSDVVGQIRFEATKPLEYHDSVSEGGFTEAYMLETSGVGSGSVYDARQLFAAEDHAETECLRRNSGGSWDDRSPRPLSMLEAS